MTMPRSSTTPPRSAPDAVSDGDHADDPAPAAETTTSLAAGVELDDAAGRRRDVSAEAANRRRQLREAEAERDAIGERLAAAQRSLVEHVLATTGDLLGDGSHARVLHRPADLWDILGAAPGDFFDENGDLNRAALAEHIAEATSDRPYLTRATGGGLPPRDAVAEAMSRAGSPFSHAATPQGSAWSEALGGR